MNENKIPDRNEDPITGEPGSHPVGVGVGTAAGATTGAAVGAVGGPVTAAVGAVVGGVAGAFAGKGVAEKIDPTVEEAYWRENHENQEWSNDTDTTYEDYEPAYRHGYTQAAERGTTWGENESELGNTWDDVKGNSKLRWDQAKHATRAGWHRVESRLPGDADNDGI